MQEILNEQIEFVFTIIIYLFVAELAVTLASKMISFAKSAFDGIDLRFMGNKGKKVKK